MNAQPPIAQRRVSYRAFHMVRYYGLLFSHPNFAEKSYLTTPDEPERPPPSLELSVESREPVPASRPRWGLGGLSPSVVSHPIGTSVAYRLLLYHG